MYVALSWVVDFTKSFHVIDLPVKQYFVYYNNYLNSTITEIFTLVLCNLCSVTCEFKVTAQMSGGARNAFLTFK